MLAGFPLSRPDQGSSPGPLVGDWSMAKQVSTNGALIDYSGNGHHGWYGGVKKALIGDTTTGVRACIFNSVASNTVTLAGLANSTTYDMTITYHDDTTDTHELTTSGAGVMTFAAATDAKFTNKQVKTIVIVPDGGGATVDTVDFTAQAQGTRSFTTGGGRTVTVNQAGTSTAEPTNLWYSGTVYGWTPGASGNNFAVPDEAALDITGSIDIRWYGILITWAPGTSTFLVNKHIGGNGHRAYAFYLDSSNRPALSISVDGSAENAGNCNVATGLAAGAAQWIRVTWNATTKKTNYYLGGSAAVPSWAALGAEQTQNIAAIYASDSAIAVSPTTGSAASTYRAVIYADLTETSKVLDIDFTALASYDAARTTLTAVTGQTVTINRSATGLQTWIVEENVALGDKVDDYISFDDHDRLDFAATEDLTLLLNGRFYGTPASTSVLAGKKSGILAANAGYQLLTDTSKQLVAQVSDGTDLASSTSAAMTAGADDLRVLRLRRAGNIVQSTVNATNSTVGDASAVGSLANTSQFKVFSDAAGANFARGGVTNVRLYRRYLTGTQIRKIKLDM